MKLYTNLDAAFIGAADVWHPDGSRVTRAVYDGAKLVDLFEADGMTQEEALEHINFNVEGGYVGPDTPIVMWPGRVETFQAPERFDA